MILVPCKLGRVTIKVISMLLISCSDDGLTSGITACISVINNWRKEENKINRSNLIKLTGWRKESHLCILY